MESKKANDPMRKQLEKYARDLAEIHQEERKRSAKLKEINDQLNIYARELSDTINHLKTTNKELQYAYEDTIHRLVIASEYRDEMTGDHIVRMSRYSSILAEKIGLDKKYAKLTLLAAPMHDVGKIGIPDAVLMKKGPLTEDEFKLVKEHTIIGGKILSDSKADVLQLAEVIALTHHEKWDGSGYPKGLKGYDIPLVGRIVALADVFDALTSKRPYKDEMEIDKAYDIIIKSAGKHFDPYLAEKFVEIKEDIIRVKREVDNEHKENWKSVGYGDERDRVNEKRNIGIRD